MFSLHVHSENLDFMDYLQQESTYQSEDDAFLFTSTEQASRVISRYIIVFLKDIHFSKMITESMLTEEDRDELLFYLSPEKMEKLYNFVYQKLLTNLLQSSSFYFEPFIQFRLHHETKMIAKMLWSAHDEFIEYSAQPSTIDSLKEILNEENPLEQTVSVIVELDGSFTIKSEKHIFLENEMEEDSMVSHLLLLSPQMVHVYELGARISQTYSVILTELFKKRVVFHGFTDGPSSYQETER